MKIGILIFQFLFVLACFYVIVGAILSLWKREEVWLKKNYDNEKKKKYITGWIIVLLLFALFITPNQINELIELWHKFYKI